MHSGVFIMNIYVGNLPYSISENELKNVFTEHGEVSGVNIITDKYSGRSKGFAFVEMPNKEEAESAIRTLNDSQLSRRSIKVNEARPRKERSSYNKRY